ncbi:hypothetical protein ACVWW1_002479 [Bradyrhizobium sp. JR3.5]
MGGTERRACPDRELLGIVEQPSRQLPVRVHRHRLGARLVLERPAAFGFELRDGLLIGAEVEPGAQREREISTVSGDAVTGEHPAQRDRAENGEQVGQEFAVHMPTIVPAQPNAPAAACRQRNMVDDGVNMQRW